MTPRPRNRHLLVELLEESGEQESAVLLPDNFKQIPAFTRAKVISIAGDCSLDVLVGEIVVFHTSMLQEISLDDYDFQMVLENHIMCVL